MSKSRGTQVAPDDLVVQYGADSLRLHLMYLGPWEQGGPWNSRGITGMERFVRRAFGLVGELASVQSEPPSVLNSSVQRELQRWMHKTIQRVTEDIADFEFNTMVAALIEFTNALTDMKTEAIQRSRGWRHALEILTLLMAPSTPFVAEEMWQMLGNPFSVHRQEWPRFDPEMARDDEVEMIVQVNGKVRDKLVVQAGISEERARSLALASDRIQELLAGKDPIRVIYVPGKLVNVVVK
jgi:leucyl-tRNA synthetase